MIKKLTTLLLVCSISSQTLAQDPYDGKSAVTVGSRAPTIGAPSGANLRFEYLKQVKAALAESANFCPPTKDHPICKASDASGENGYIDPNIMGDPETKKIIMLLNARLSDIVLTFQEFIDSTVSVSRSKLDDSNKTAALYNDSKKAFEGLSSRLWGAHPLFEDPASFQLFYDPKYFPAAAIKGLISAREKLELNLRQLENGHYFLDESAAENLIANASLESFTCNSVRELEGPAQADASSAINATVDQCNTTAIRDAICSNVSQSESPLAGSQNECPTPETQGSQTAGSAADDARKNSYSDLAAPTSLLTYFIYNIWSQFQAASAPLVPAGVADQVGANLFPSLRPHLAARTALTRADLVAAANTQLAELDVAVTQLQDLTQDKARLQSQVNNAQPPLFEKWPRLLVGGVFVQAVKPFLKAVVPAGYEAAVDVVCLAIQQFVMLAPASGIAMFLKVDPALLVGYPLVLGALSSVFYFSLADMGALVEYLNGRPGV
jgi:hypothetical protein